jgi:CDP-diacylglycerol--serine O-phosphatidyltransferase
VDVSRTKRRRVGGRQRRIRERLARGGPGRARRRVPRSAVPSFFTLLNLFSGFLAVTQIAEGNFHNACWLIVLAGFFDLLDGMMARMTRSQSPFGVELDSLSDVVSFGLAPSFLVYEFGLRDAGPLGLIVSSLPAVCGAVRLARFNVRATDEKKDYFEGLPIPVQAAFIVALILNVSDPQSFRDFSPGNLSGLIPVVAVLSALMVSTIRFDALPRPTRGFIRANRWKTITYLVALVALAVFQQIGLLAVLTIYIVHALFRSLRNVFVDPVQGE